jgi:uncharacterized protein YwgA
VTLEPEADEVEELAREIRRIIESNRVFLERVNDEEYEDEDEESDPGKQSEPVTDDYEEL